MDEGRPHESPLPHQAARAAVERVAQDYIRGWYLGDTDRMARALDRDLVKRMPVDHGSALRSVSRQRMISPTKAGGGGDADAETRVVVDHVEDDIASARTESPDYLDYLHLARGPDGWRIVNILFHPRT